MKNSVILHGLNQNHEHYEKNTQLIFYTRLGNCNVFL